MSERPFERVLTMTDFWDGPRRGIANFDGTPHFYESDHDEAADQDFFELRPVDDETLQLALEDWAIWLRWQAALEAGETTPETHPALPADRARSDELAAIVPAKLAALPGPVIRMLAVFRGQGPDLEVQWTPLPHATRKSGDAPS